MISELKLINGYIENDKGKFRELFVEAAIFYGYKIPFDKDIDWLDYEYLYTDELTMDIVTGRNPFKNNKLTIEDFVEYRTSNRETKSALVEVKNCTFTSPDIFQQMLKVAQDNNLFIQFDGFTEDENATIVVTKQGSDVEYVIQTQEHFNQLVECFNVLEKFERK